MSRTYLLAPIALCLFVACRSKPDETLFTLVNTTGVDFTNELTESKDFNVFKYRNFYNGGGVATGDLNNDGLPEIFFTANQGTNKLYLNKGDFKFEDISVTAGFIDKDQWSTGVVFADINADGWLDIYVCNAGNMLDKALRKNQLFINNKDLTFTDKAAEYGLDNDGYSTQASFFDYDLDGDLDCFLVNNSPIPVNTLNYANMRSIPDSASGYPPFLKGGGDHLYRNEQGRFREVNKEAGIFGSIISFGLGVTVGDVNEDGYPDIYVSNDFFEKDYLYINQQDGRFRDELEQRMQHISFSSMGADIQDINNDGRPDIFTTDMLPGDDYRLKTNTTFEGYEVFDIKRKSGFYNQFTQNALQVNNGQGKFLETAFYSGVAASDWSWGALIFDADNDALSDIIVCNGIYRDVTDQDFIDFFANDVVKQMTAKGMKEEVGKVIDKMPSIPIPNKAFRNLGGLRFTDESLTWGLDKPSFSNGASYADLDHDGDLDLIISNVNQQAMVYRNNAVSTSGQNGHISLTLTYQGQNPFAIGSTIRTFVGDQILLREIIPSRGFQSSVEYRQTIGLGGRKPDSIQVIWPDRMVTTLISPQTGIHHMVDRKKVIIRPHAYRQDAVSDPFFTVIEAGLETQSEDEYVDFHTERNIPFMLSKLGPAAAVADVNGDGKDDLYISGSKQQPGQLYLQKNNGFQKKSVKDFEQFSFNDVNTAFFFDHDGDGDQDLFTGGGGNFAPATSEDYQNHLFINDGTGDFKLKRGAFPVSHLNCGTIIPLDFNADGRMDLLIGNRSVPQQYGQIPESSLFMQTADGIFNDVTEQVAPFLKLAGMLTSAAWKDIDGDRTNEIILVGEWTYPRIYRYTGKRFEEINTGLETFHGWWQRVVVQDIDMDGDNDLILGNLGENFYLRPDRDHPVKLWIHDFDQNGTIDKILTQRIGDRDMPVFMKKDMVEQLPGLKKSNLKNKDYANKSIDDLFGDVLDKAAMLKVDMASSCIARNDGKGRFTLERLPDALQLSSLHAIALVDMNADGYPDLLTAGNFFDLLPQFCRIDASYGNLSLNDGKGVFNVVHPSRSGISINGQVKSIQPIRFREKNCFVFTQNSEIPVMYQQVSSGVRESIAADKK
jgi:hypothetical protein